MDNPPFTQYLFFVIISIIVGTLFGLLLNYLIDHYNNKQQRKEEEKTKLKEEREKRLQGIEKERVKTLRRMLELYREDTYDNYNYNKLLNFAIEENVITGHFLYSRRITPSELEERIITFVTRYEIQEVLDNYNKLKKQINEP